MKDKLNINSNLRLTKSHTIPYFEHTYSLNIYSEDNYNIPNNEFCNYFKSSQIFRKSFLRYYVSIKENVTEDEIIGYFNAKGITELDHSIKNEICKAFISNKVFKNIRANIIDCLNNLKIGNETNMIFSKIYTLLDNEIQKSYNMYFIINSEMKNNIINKNIKRCFADVTYKYIPPSFVNYKLFILCGIDVI